MSLKNLANLDSKELKDFLDSFDNVLCDCDGVVWHLGTPLPEVHKSITKLKDLGKKVCFVTNNSYVPPEGICSILQKCKIEADPQDVINPCSAIISYLKKIKLTRAVFVLGSRDYKQEVRNAGFDVIQIDETDLENTQILNNPNFLEGLKGDINNIGAVILDVDLSLSYYKLLKIVLCLQNPDVLFFITCPDKIVPIGPSLTAFGPHYFIKPIQDMTQREPVLFGKPGSAFNDFLVEKLQIQNPSRTLFIGDNLVCDIEFATKSGYQTLLTLTGVTKLEQITSSIEVARIPNFYISSLGDLHEILQSKFNM